MFFFFKLATCSRSKTIFENHCPFTFMDAFNSILEERFAGEKVRHLAAWEGKGRGRQVKRRMFKKREMNLWPEKTM